MSVLLNRHHRTAAFLAILVGLLFGSPLFLLPADARLGLTKDRCDALYGPPLKENLDGSFLYSDGDYAFVLFFDGGACDEVFVLKPAPGSDGDRKLKLVTDDVARFLDENRPTPQHNWAPVDMQAGNGMGWKTEDSQYEAFLLPGGEQMILSTAVAATARRLDLPRRVSGPKPVEASSASPSGGPSSPDTEAFDTGVPTIFEEHEMTYYHLALTARKINDHKTVISALNKLYGLIRGAADDDAEKANARFGYFFSWLGDAYDQSGNALMATRCYQRFLDNFPLADSKLETSVAVANNLTWLLATHVDPAIRAPNVALEYAQELEKRERLPEPCHDTIAVAYAAVGRFDEALAKLDSIAANTRDPDLLRVLSQHRELFQKNTPYIEDPKPEKRR